ncbi:lipopolysaccharide biosynthesis protein [Enterococcus casseliflavus]|uniref:lipopolysaccharide biosynthesis protein n=1 Tax=Enterococcus casseliflavus TaxID=37734 RepID=UPI0017817570|nr:lipopolysaccharide biosynthesis protein [Enterococcus casseliflavus]QOG30505.1 lipopolysaccharide biosynthesis protein [Enterococcus casseliflavus]
MIKIETHFKTGLLYTAVGKFSGLFTNFLVSVILSRILSPEDYGIVAIVQVFILFFQMLIEAGMGPAIIQKKDLLRRDISILFNYSVILAIILSVSFGIFGNALSMFYNNKIYIKIAWIQSLSIFFNGLNVVPTALLNKEKKFRELNFNQIIAGIISSTVGISLALMGVGVYSLIWTAIIQSIIYLMMNLVKVKMYFIFKLDFKVLRKILSFSINQFAFNFINYFSRNADNMLVGRYIGATALGNYSKAYQLLMMPNSVFLGIIGPVLQPILSDYQDDTMIIKKTYLKIVKFLALVGMPLSVFLSIFAKDVIFFVFGAQWSDAVFPFRSLACTVWIQMTLSSTGAIFQARNKARELFITGVISACILVTSIAVGVSTNNLDVLSLILTVAFFVNYFVNFSRVMRLALNDNLLTMLKELKSPFLIAILEIFTLLIVKYFLSENFNVFINLLISGVIFVVTFIFGLYFTKELKNFLKIVNVKGNSK